MAFLLTFPTPITMAGFSAVLVFLSSLFWISRRNNKKNLPPQASGAWPILGHLPLFFKHKNRNKIFNGMTDKYGPIYAIKIGVKPAIVVSSWELAKECLTTNDKAFANRPKTLISELMGYNRAMFGFSPYGPYWRHLRKIATLELLSNHRLQTLKHVREYEIKAAVKEIYELWEKDVDDDKVCVEMKKWLGDITLNVIYRIIVGKRYVEYTKSSDEREEDDEWREAVMRFFEMAGKFVVSDALPFLRWLDLGGQGKAMKKTAKELDYHVQGWLEEHKRKRASGKMNGDEDFMDVMLSILEDSKELSSHDADTINKATCLSLVMAASDSTRFTMIWALAQLLNSRDVLKKVQEELDTHIGRERLPCESDTKNLVYLHAVIKETLRLNTPAPMGFPHESMEDCTVGGYHVPAGTRLMVNIAKIQRDPRVWPDPDKFRPERFLTTHKDYDVKGQNFEFIPFGSGRRMCAGSNFALQIMHLTLATLLHGFEISTPSEKPVAFAEDFSLTNNRTSKLEVLLTPRLPVYAYKQNNM